MDLADRVFDYCYSKRGKQLHWRYWSPVNIMLHNKPSHSKITAKQDLWINHTIEKYNHDIERMKKLFSSIKELPCERRRKAVEKFLTLNADPDVFKQLPLESSYCRNGGPYMQERIEYLQSLLPLVSGIKYLKQRQRIEQEINVWKARIRSEEVCELMASWQC